MGRYRCRSTEEPETLASQSEKDKCFKSTTLSWWKAPGGGSDLLVSVVSGFSCSGKMEVKVAEHISVPAIYIVPSSM